MARILDLICVLRPAPNVLGTNHVSNLSRSLNHNRYWPIKIVTEVDPMREIFYPNSANCSALRRCFVQGFRRFNRCGPIPVLAPWGSHITLFLSE